MSRPGIADLSAGGRSAQLPPPRPPRCAYLNPGLTGCPRRALPGRDFCAAHFAAWLGLDGDLPLTRYLADRFGADLVCKCGRAKIGDDGRCPRCADER